MSAATTCYWCYRCSRYVRILTDGGDSPVVCTECGGSFLVEFGRRQPRRNNYGDGGTGDDSNRIERCCAVCLEALELGNEVLEMPCKHIYHSHCVLPWLARRNSCRQLYQQPMESPVVMEGARGRHRGGVMQFVCGLFSCFHR